MENLQDGTPADGQCVLVDVEVFGVLIRLGTGTARDQDRFVGHETLRVPHGLCSSVDRTSCAGLVWSGLRLFVWLVSS